MKRVWSYAVAVGLVLGFMIAPPTVASGVVLTPADPNRQCGWPINYPGTANYAFPDTSAAYFVQAAIIGPGDQIVISGQDPKAVYWSMQTYRFSDSTLIDSVNDVSVTRAKKKGRATKKWTITVTSPDRDNGRNPNVLSAAGDFDGVNFGSNITVIMYRVYVSRTKTESGGPMPRVTLRTRAADGTYKQTRLKPCTKKQIGLPENRPNLFPQEGIGDVFVRGPAARFYPSADTSYLVAQAAHRSDQILVMTGKAPRAPRDVRYWSVCNNVNAGELPVVGCLRGDQMRMGRDGSYAVAIVSDEQQRLLAGGRYSRMNFIRWGDRVNGAHYDAFLVFRNILPARNFAGSASRVPVGEEAAPIIGDYSPTLTYLSIEEFEQLYGSTTP
jgi:hypothetical protein